MHRKKRVGSIDFYFRGPIHTVKSKFYGRVTLELLNLFRRREGHTTSQHALAVPQCHLGRECYITVVNTPFVKRMLWIEKKSIEEVELYVVGSIYQVVFINVPFNLTC